MPFGAARKFQAVSRALFLCAVFGGLLLGSSSAFAVQSVSLAWNPSPDATGYHVYYGTESGNYDQRMTVNGATVATVSGLVEGVTYYFVVTAYDTQGLESSPSNEVSYTVPGILLRLRPMTVPGSGLSRAFTFDTTGNPGSWVLEMSYDMKTWKGVVGGGGAPADIPVLVSAKRALFFRLKSPSPGMHLITRRMKVDGAPNAFFVTVRELPPPQWEIEVSDDLVAWNTLAKGTNTPVKAAVIVSDAPAMFFRLKVQ